MILLTLTRVIDWDFVQVTPLMTAVQHPLFIADIPGWHNDGVKEGETFEDDRRYLVEVMAREEQRRKMDSSRSHMLKDSSGRQFFEASLHNREISRKYIERYIQRTDKALLTAQMELDRFIERNKDFNNDPRTIQLRATLDTNQSEPRL
jgi:hypothetical protein